jgi:hypothetical protein
MKKLLGILIAVVVTLALVAVPVIANGGGETVTTGASVNGGGSPPRICCKFETPDHDPDVSGTQVLPVADGQRMMKFYVVVTDPNDNDTIASVDVTVRYPDGTEKFQLRAIRGTDSWKQLMWDEMIDMDGDCTGDMVMSEALPELDSQGRIAYGPSADPAYPMDLGSVLYDLQNDKQIMLELVGYMDCHQPAVVYTVEAVATDDGGSTSSPVSNTFDYLSIVALQIDFSAVQWNGVEIAQWNYLLGDEDMLTSYRPTVKNVGNDPAMLMVNATPLLGQTAGKTIEEFDAEMDEKDFTTGVITKWGRIEFPADEDWIITDRDDPTLPIILPPCHPTQIDFSVHPPLGTLQDTYVGEMTLTILHHEASVVNPYVAP